VKVVALSKHRTKKELARLARSLDPLSEVPPRIEPLAPPSRLSAPAPTWSQSVGVPNPGARPRARLATARLDGLDA
jgi:hypothetical protein